MNCNDDNVGVLMYANDVVLLSDSCQSNDITVNCSKSNIVNFRNLSVVRTSFVLKCGNNTLQNVDKYTYLGLLLSEPIVLEMTARFDAPSSYRASNGGFPCFYEITVVYPVISYDAYMCGFISYSCINAVQNSAMCLFLGVGKYIQFSH